MQIDKLVHFLGCFMVCIILSRFIPMQYSAMIVILLGAIKEIVYDGMIGKGTPEIKDFIADCVGVVFAIIFS